MESFHGLKATSRICPTTTKQQTYGFGEISRKVCQNVKWDENKPTKTGDFFARFATMIFAITCISNLIATKFDDKDAYLLILELAVKLVWSSASCDHMNSSSPIIVHFPSVVFLISSIFKSRVSSSKAWIKVVFGHPLCSGHKTSFFSPLCLTQSSSPLFTK